MNADGCPGGSDTQKKKKKTIRVRTRTRTRRTRRTHLSPHTHTHTHTRACRASRSVRFSVHNAREPSTDGRAARENLVLRRCVRGRRRVARARSVAPRVSPVPSPHGATTHSRRICAKCSAAAVASASFVVAAVPSAVNYQLSGRARTHADHSSPDIIAIRSNSTPPPPGHQSRIKHETCSRDHDPLRHVRYGSMGPGRVVHRETWRVLEDRSWPAAQLRFWDLHHKSSLEPYNYLSVGNFFFFLNKIYLPLMNRQTRQCNAFVVEIPSNFTSVMKP